MFFGDAHNLVAVGIYPCGLGLALFGVVLQVHGTVIALIILDFPDKHLFPGEVVSLFPVVKRDMVPLRQPLGIAVGVVPVVFEARMPGLFLALLLALLCLLLVLLTVKNRIDKGDVTFGGVILQVGCKFLAVGELNVLLLD